MPFVNVKLIKGVFDADQKREMIEKLTNTMVEIEGESMRPVTWVTIERSRAVSGGSAARPSPPRTCAICSAPQSAEVAMRRTPAVAAPESLRPRSRKARLRRARRAAAPTTPAQNACRPDPNASTTRTDHALDHRPQLERGPPRTVWRPGATCAIFRTARLDPRQRSRGRPAGQPRSGLLRSDDGRRAVSHPRSAGARRRRRTPRQWFDASLAMAHADASAGWIFAQGAVQNAWLAVAADERFARDYFKRPQTIATSSAGRPTAELIDGVYVVQARWASVSGCTSADFVGGMVVTAGPGGSPETRMVLQPGAAAIEPTWDTLGLRHRQPPRQPRRPRRDTGLANLQMARPRRDPTGDSRQRDHDHRDGVAGGRGGAARAARGRSRSPPTPPNTSSARSRTTRLIAQAPFIRGFAGCAAGSSWQRPGCGTCSMSCGTTPPTGRPRHRRTGPHPAGRHRSGHRRRRRGADGRLLVGADAATGRTRWSV